MQNYFSPVPHPLAKWLNCNLQILLLGLLLCVFILPVACKKSNPTPAAPAPSISSISPVIGAAGTTVTISGGNFDATAANNTVKFNGVSATINSASSTSLVVLAPVGGSTGPVSVGTAAGNTSGPVFTYTIVVPVPTITSINPNTGPAGTVVTITGTNFDITAANNTVKFNGTIATVSSATATSIVVQAPAGGTSGAVTVTNTGGTATGAAYTYTAAVVGDVYVGGFEGNASAHIAAKYWKNGVGTALTDGTKDGAVYGIFVAGADVYAAGFEWKGPAGPTNNDIAKYWKNGTATALTAGNTSARASSIFVAGTDVYVAGYEVEGFHAVAKYWKNGTAVAVSNVNNDAQAMAIFVSGTDVYVAGIENSSGTSGHLQGKIWKNGVPTTLANAGRIFSIYVAGTDVYAAGDYDAGGGLNNAIYWKNGAVVLPDNPGLSSTASGIFVSGTDVYVSGSSIPNSSSNSLINYWKNGTGVSLADGGLKTTASGIFVAGSDVYLSGYYNVGGAVYAAKYWKNGVSTTLTNGLYNSNATCIVVK